MERPRCIIVPGNGGGNVEDCNWYGWARQELEDSSAFAEVGRSVV